MKSFHFISALLCLLLSFAAAGPLVAKPLPGTKGIKITKENTVNATTSKPAVGNPRVWQLFSQTPAGQLDLSVVNNLPSDNVNVYVTGLDANGALVLLQPNGQWFYPAATNASVPQRVTMNVATPLGPQGTTTNITLPGYIQAGRIWFADGELEFFTVGGANGAPNLVEPSAVNPSDPSANVNWGFVELTWGEGIGIYANISYVDFVGLPLGMALTNAAGITQSAWGVSSNAVAEICGELTAQAAQDGQPWDQLCMVDTSGNPLRVLSPVQLLAINPNSFDGYWSDYVDQVWDFYSNYNLTIDTQAAPGLVNCSVPTNSSMMYCDGDNRGYAKPTPSDIFGCNAGPFGIMGGDNGVHYAVVPRLCAAFHRTTSMIVPGGHMQPGLNSSWYYASNPTNHYSKVVHEYEVDGKGYAFAYDDVTPDGAENESGLLADPNPVLLTLTVGGPSCSGSGCVSQQVGGAPSSSAIASTATSSSTSSKSSTSSSSSSSTSPSTTSSTSSTISSTSPSTITSTSSTSSSTKISISSTSKSTTSPPSSSSTSSTKTTTTKTKKSKASKAAKSTSTTPVSSKAKGGKKTKSPTALSTSTSTTVASPTPAPNSNKQLSCPSSNGTVFSSSADSSSFMVQCYQDPMDGVMAFTATSSFTDCINMCATDFPGCIWVSYTTGGVCYFKNVVNWNPTAVQTVWGAQMLPTSAAVTTPPATSASVEEEKVQTKKTRTKTKGVDSVVTPVRQANGVDVGNHGPWDLPPARPS